MSRPFVPSVGMPDMPAPALDAITVNRSVDAIEVVVLFRAQREHDITAALMYLNRSGVTTLAGCCIHQPNDPRKSWREEDTLTLPGLVRDVTFTIADELFRNPLP